MWDLMPETAAATSSEVAQYQLVGLAPRCVALERFSSIMNASRPSSYRRSSSGAAQWAICSPGSIGGEQSRWLLLRPDRNCLVRVRAYLLLTELRVSGWDCSLVCRCLLPITELLKGTSPGRLRRHGGLDPVDD